MRLSATIRLHQVKYDDKTGIPPVDQGVLMVYNVGKIDDKDETNSIFNRDIIEKYLYNFDDYSLQLNLALPAYSWSIVYSQESPKVRLIENLDQRDFELAKLAERLDSTHFIIKNDGVIKNTFFKKGDQVRVEQPSIADLN